VALSVALGTGGGRPGVLAVPVGDGGAALETAVRLADHHAAAVRVFLADTEHTGAAGTVQVLPRPGERPRRLLLVGVSEGGEADWRAAGAAAVRAAARDAALTVALPPDADPAAVAGLAEGALLAGYRYRDASSDDNAPTLRRVTLAVADPSRYGAALAAATVVAEATCLARDLTNTHSARKSPRWLADTIVREAERAGLRATVRDAAALRAEGFGGILAVGGGSPHPPQLVELRHRPRGATRHVVLVGKGITFDTGGVQIKTANGMLLMRKDMGGAAAVAAATIGAARLGLGVKITALLPMAENAISGDAYRPGDVVRHYGGLTSEIFSTDAEGRLVVGDALAYAARRLAPDVLIDLATLTGAQSVALGKQTAALYGTDDALVAALREAADAAGERVWRMPLPDDYESCLDSDVADLTNVEEPRQAGSVMAALFLRRFAGAAGDRWLHLDMSAPAWSATADGIAAKGATGWGVRTLLRFLAG
jgi:leucyl aminopeptidase